MQAVDEDAAEERGPVAPGRGERGAQAPSCVTPGNTTALDLA
ncbi:hypothetical protein ACIG3E_20600 [Streptomyces sp. NPDC053474]